MSVDAISSPAEMVPHDAESSLARVISEVIEHLKASVPPPHPVKDVVLPLVVVIGLIGNALVVGVAWGRFSQRMDTHDAIAADHARRLTKQEEGDQAIRDRVRDLERDVEDADRRFHLFDDYTRGRIDRLPYKAPPPARW